MDLLYNFRFVADLIQVVELGFNQHGRNVWLSVCLHKCGRVNVGQSYTAPFALKHLRVFINLAILLSKNASGLHEADMVSFRCFVHVFFSSTCVFNARCTIVQSAVLRLHIIRLSVCPSVCDVDGSVPHSLEILETNCMDY